MARARQKMTSVYARTQRGSVTSFLHNIWDPVNILPSPHLIHIFLKYLTFSKLQAEAWPHPIETRTGSHSCCTHHRHLGAKPSAGGVSSRQSVPFFSSLLPCPWPFLLGFSISPSGGHLLAPHWYRVSQPANAGRIQPPLPSHHL